MRFFEKAERRAGFTWTFACVLITSVRIEYVHSVPLTQSHNLSHESTIQSNSAYAKSSPWLKPTTPVLGRVGLCINERLQRWRKVGQLGSRQVELELVKSGKFVCPRPNETWDMTYCCGPVKYQFCCRLQDTPGLKWGIAVGVVVTLIVFLTVSYTIQVFRVCDRCYHECPIFGLESDETEFQFNTRWYTVSHEGNRYGVTFHSRGFANEFMQRLENRYGRWNTANILKIQREGQDFVILSIFFHDLFTPWFYTQGPIKNDEEWIRTDFKNMCQAVKASLRVSSCFPRSKSQFKDDQPSPINEELGPESPKVDDSQMSLDRNRSRSTRKWIPWTKAIYLPPIVRQPSVHEPSQAACSKQLLQRRNSRYNPFRRSEKREHSETSNTVVMEDSIECNGLEKGVQTKPQCSDTICSV